MIIKKNEIVHTKLQYIIILFSKVDLLFAIYVKKKKKKFLILKDFFLKYMTEISTLFM